jgi:hypothetical protein
MPCPAAEVIQGNIFYPSVSSDPEIKAKVLFWETLPPIPKSDFFILELQGNANQEQVASLDGLGVSPRLFCGQFHRWQYW